MWPGEYPPEGISGDDPRLDGAPRFNVAGGVSPGRSRRDLVKAEAKLEASMWPGEYPPEGHHRREHSPNRDSDASMWPGEYPPEGPHPRPGNR